MRQPPEARAQLQPYPPPGQLGPRAIAAWAVRTRTDGVRVEGIGNVPATGPVMLVARHFHHLLDGAVLVRAVPRPLHIVVGLDWARNPLERAVMEWACRAAHYPIVLRPGSFENSGTGGGPRAYRREELLRYTRGALSETTRLLRDGRVVVVFPEAYPNVDPAFSRKGEAGEFLPFARGYLSMAARAERDGATRVAVVPVGFTYTATTPDRWSVTVRFGEPCATREPDAIERAVRRLCEPGVASMR